MTDNVSRETLIAAAESALGQLTEAEAAQVIARSRQADRATKKQHAAQKLSQYLTGGTPAN
jgi:hypothetical protein